MRLGILGTGKIVQDFLPMVKMIPTIELVGLLSTPRSVERAHALQTTYNIETVYTDYEALLADATIDTVYVALPNSLHYTYAKQALQAGKNVICEKPFTLVAAQLTELQTLALKQDLVLIEAITNQYLENYQAIKRDLTKLGDLKIIECNYSQYSSRYDQFKAGTVLPAFNPKLGGGALMDLNIYNIHFVVGLLGAPTRVQYVANIERDIDTSGILILTYPDVQVVCIGSKDSTSPVRSTIQGTAGSIVVNGPTNTVESFTEITHDGATTDLALNQADHRMHAEFVAFERIIAEHDMVTVKRQLAHSQAVMAVVDQALASAGLQLG
ncbi:Gfo/Idh/MocA family protein [Lactiplantibacillus paraplantarum]|uniref:Oxidoreductase n=1 Tax=Lactiplantibacillus paraplantarum TaxID=60520 RepID=A0AAD0X8C0_9LACO|nr:Gfo/Idh/MocA family oxidoreductase [Lactiplantibacillus paraplantarum]AVW10944.1 gfo/Idh/MocA family oxidoreductase [Lactiplantibacillus paraplantarum]AYJ39350.1 gfo/Idh/MocA family oxidoreductase [Lactiplantibacillus paraplantarum]ERL42783.1 oxidoreductase [Lactiplantibacillus paraplantarum]KRL49793.1 oxidoreductase [Lactiplantibacillus paraplantarum DSM 10667]MCT4457366.1 gfo/Idh/MocA family oxidoreductase [Lactiplantibacillus paraplantarum]